MYKLKKEEELCLGNFNILIIIIFFLEKMKKD